MHILKPLLFQEKASGIIVKSVICSWPISSWIEARKEIWSMPGTPDTPIVACYNYNNDYVGDVSIAKMLAGKAIRPETSNAGNTVCSIGFSPPYKQWFGWSHRAICAFGIGDKLFEEDFGNDHTLFTEHGEKTIETLDEARIAAVNFASSVS